MTEILYPATSSARKRNIVGVVILALVATALVRAGLAFPAVLSPPAIPTTAYLGAWNAPRSGESQSDAVLRVESQIGRRFAIDHYYYQWTDSFPNAAQTWTVGQGRTPFINWKAGGSWSAIANGSQDAVIIAHADAIKSFGYPIYLSFHHEPEDDLGSFGSPSRLCGGVPPHRGRVPRPGRLERRVRVDDDVVDVRTQAPGGTPWTTTPVMPTSTTSVADGYNWYPGRAGDDWTSFQEIFTDTNAFAIAHNKPWMVVEFGAQEDPAVPGRKAQWLLDALATAKSWPSLKALIYFDDDKDGYPVGDGQFSHLRWPPTGRSRWTRT